MISTKRPDSESELEAILTSPSAALIDLFERIEGDVLILGAGGKMGPSLAVLAKRAIASAHGLQRVICASRFTDVDSREKLESKQIDCISCDLLDRVALYNLPNVANVIYLAGMKFGSSSAQAETWAMNVLLPAMVAERFASSKIVVLSTGNVYPFVSVTSLGANEATEPQPVGEYAQSCLGRERMFEYASSKWGVRSVIMRLNYATDLRYGALVDIADKVWNRLPIDLSMGYLNCIWQGDANEMILRSLEHVSAPPNVINLTGLDTISVRWAGEQFALRLDRTPKFEGTESDTALLNDASRCYKIFGPPRIELDSLVDWIANWVRSGGTRSGKPTHFQTRDGKF